MSSSFWRQELLRSDDDPPDNSGVFLVFRATQAQPEFAKLFLEDGGGLRAAAAAAPTDFALSRSKAATVAELHQTVPRTVRIELPASLILERKGDRVALPRHTKLNGCSSRVGVGSNGTIVDTHAGAGSLYLRDLLDARGEPLQMPFRYSALSSHGAAVAFANARLENEKSEPVHARFDPDDEEDKLLPLAEQLIEAYATDTWNIREQRLPYPEAQGLTKSVARQPVGINASGFDLVHNILDRKFPFGANTLNSMLETVISDQFGYCDETVANFLEDTAAPGLRAAAYAKKIASAMSVMAAYLVSYRSDGRTHQAATGATFEETESWLRMPMRSPHEANDCDGSACLITAALNACLGASEIERARYKWLGAVRNALFPYYTPGVTVVAASAAEASSAGAAHVAGHAVSVLVPTHALVRALDASEGHASVNKARIDACFGEALAELPADEAALFADGGALLGSRNKTDQAVHELAAFACEGTSACSSDLFVPDAQKRNKARFGAECDEAALKMAEPHVGRPLRVLHTGANDHHRFYKDFLELVVHPAHPLYASEELRKAGVAGSQFVLCAHSMRRAGVAPQDLSVGHFCAVPMRPINAQEGALLDFASRKAAEDVIPARHGPAALDLHKSRGMLASMASIRALDTSLRSREGQGHEVCYFVSFSTLCNNPAAVQHMCERIGTAAVTGLVDFKTIEGLATYHPEAGQPLGEAAGNFVTITATMPV